MSPSDPVGAFFSISEYLYPRVGPDGDRVAAFGNPRGGHEIHVVEVDSDEIARLESDETPRNPSPNSMLWAADGDALYVMNNESVSNFKLDDSDTETPVYRVRLDGELDHLFTVEGECRLWAVHPDTEYLYYQHDDGLHYYDPSVETHETFPTYPGFCHIGGGGVSPDGRRVAYTSNPYDDPDNSDVYLAAPDGSDARRLEISEKGLRTAAQAWHPEGKRLLVNETTDVMNRSTRTGIYDLETESVDWIAEAPGIAFVSDGDAILAGDGPTVYDVDGQSRDIAIPGWTRFDPVAAENAITVRGFVVTRASETRPREILYHDLRTDTTSVLLESEFGEIDPDDVVEPKAVTHDLPGGDTAEGIIFDSGERPSPAVVRVYGARTSPGTKFDRTTQLLLHLGYTVFLPSFPGDPFTDAEHEAFAVAGEWLKNRDRIDEDRVGVFGHSHGGYNVYMQVVRYPEVWTAAIASSGMVDLLRCDEGVTAPYMYGEMGDPEGNTDRWRDQSPIEYVNETTVPLLMVHGAEDFLSIEQPRQFAEALRAQGWTEAEDFVFEEIEEYGHISNDSTDEQHKWEIITDFLAQRI